MNEDMAHLRVLTANANIHQDLVDAIKSKVSMSDRFVVTKENWDSVKMSVSYKPLFSKYYVIEIHMLGLDKKVLREIIKLSEEGYLKLIFNCTSVRDFESLEKIDNLKLLSYNGYNPDDRVMFRFIQARLSYTLPDSHYFQIKKRLRGNYGLLETFLDKLNLYKPTTLTELKKVVPNMSKTGLWVFFMKLLGREDSKTVFKVVSDYEFGGKFLLEYIQDLLSKLITMYRDFSNGTFNDKTILSYASDNKDKIKKLGFKDYQLKDILEIYKKHSFNELIILKEVVDKGIQSGKEIGYSYSLYQTVTELMNIKVHLIAEINRLKGLNQE